MKFDDSGRLVGDAAAAAPTAENGGISRDGLTVVYHLRKNLRFADGKPLTARDCVLVIGPCRTRPTTCRRGTATIVLQARAPRSDHARAASIKEPFAPLVTLVLAPQGLPILPEHALAKYPNFNHAAFSELPIGSGPYVVTRWDRGDRVEMRANPYYWQGKPRIERLTVRFVADANTAINLLRTHEIGGFFNDEDLGNYSILRAIAGTYVSNEPIDAVGAIIFNTRDALTSDPRVRHALAEAIDVKSVVENVPRRAYQFRRRARPLYLGIRSQRLSRRSIRSEGGRKTARFGRLDVGPDGFRAGTVRPWIRCSSSKRRRPAIKSSATW